MVVFGTVVCELGVEVFGHWLYWEYMYGALNESLGKKGICATDVCFCACYAVVNFRTVRFCRDAMFFL